MKAAVVGCHRSHVPDRVVVEKLIEVSVSGCTYDKMAYNLCSTTTWVVGELTESTAAAW